MTAQARLAALAALLCALPSCAALFPVSNATPSADASLPGDVGAVVADAGVADAPDSAAGTDAAADVAPSCDCPSGLVRLVGACVPTPALGCGPSCVGKAPSACPAQGVCDEAAAHVPCAPETPAAACVPNQAMHFGPGDLRVAPNVVAKGEPVTLLVSGGNFYIGALMWWGRIGADVVQAVEWEAPCTLKLAWTPAADGLYPVSVAYGGSADHPNDGYALAGFVRVGAGPSGVQPGYACSDDVLCLEGGGWACGCVSGRCGCEQP